MTTHHTRAPTPRPLAAAVLLAVTLGSAGWVHGLRAQTPPVGDSAPETLHRPGSPRAVLDSILETSPFHRMHWGVAVHNVETGEAVLLHNADRLFSAASTMKLVTTAAALDQLGPDFRFRTNVVGTWDAKGVTDSLRVVGGGDPTLSPAFFADPLAPLDSLADSLAAAGLRRVTGPLIIDQSAWDSVPIFPAWEAFDLDWYYAAPVAPFAVMGASWEIVVVPGAPGETADVRLPWAEGLVVLDAEIRTGSGDDDWDDLLFRAPDTDSLVLRGSIGAGAGPDTSWIAQTEPGRAAGRAFRRALEAAGIRVDGPVVVRYVAGPGTDGPDATTVSWHSPPLRGIVRVALEQSDNWITEQLMKSLSARLMGLGSWSGGRMVVSRMLTHGVGVPTDAFYLRDGSGLTPQGLLTPATVSALLRWVPEQAWSETFRDALAHPGEPESTLDDRLLDYPDRVAAKTGTLRNVNALSGYLTTRSGRELAFSILNNGSGQPSWTVQPALDRIVESLIEGGY